MHVPELTDAGIKTLNVLSLDDIVQCYLLTFCSAIQSCMYLAHHELESVKFTIVVIIVITLIIINITIVIIIIVIITIQGAR